MHVTNPDKAKELLYLSLVDLLVTSKSPNVSGDPEVTFSDFLGHSLTIKASTSQNPREGLVYSLYVGKEGAGSKLVFSSTARPGLTMGGGTTDPANVRQRFEQGVSNVYSGEKPSASDVFYFAADVAQKAVSSNYPYNIERNYAHYLVEAYKKGFVEIDEFSSPDAYCYDAQGTLLFRSPGAKDSGIKTRKVKGSTLSCIATRESDGTFSLRLKMDTKFSGSNFSVDLAAKANEGVSGTCSLDGKPMNVSNLLNINLPTKGEVDYNEFESLPSQQMAAYLAQMMMRTLLSFWQNQQGVIVSEFEQSNMEVDLAKAALFYSN